MGLAVFVFARVGVGFGWVCRFWAGCGMVLLWYTAVLAGGCCVLVFAVCCLVRFAGGFGGFL